MNYIENRTLTCAKYLVLNNSTVRKTAAKFNLSKSTLHHDLHKYLANIDANLYFKVLELLYKNFKEKHIRGGESTKKKYKKTGNLKWANVTNKIPQQLLK